MRISNQKEAIKIIDLALLFCLGIIFLFLSVLILGWYLKINFGFIVLIFLFLFLGIFCIVFTFYLISKKNK
jgi:hypothetical protein